LDTSTSDESDGSDAFQPYQSNPGDCNVTPHHKQSYPEPVSQYSVLAPLTLN